jgi:hypothetical protein
LAYDIIWRVGKHEIPADLYWQVAAICIIEILMSLYYAKIITCSQHEKGVPIKEDMQE